MTGKQDIGRGSGGFIEMASLLLFLRFLIENYVLKKETFCTKKERKIV